MKLRDTNRKMGAGLGLLALAVLMLALEVAPAWAQEKGNMVFFRGGFAGLNSNRANELFTDARNPLGLGSNDGSTGWYVAGGLDLLLAKDAWGLMKGVSVLGEIGVEFKRFNSQRVTNTGNLGVGLTAPAGLQVTSTTPSTVELTMLTVDISPKFKFMEGSKLRPWIIPVGLDFHVISPPSNQTQYLDIGAQFGAGVEYNIWRDFWLGLDGRYHLTANMTNTTNSFGTIGGYVGIGF